MDETNAFMWTMPGRRDYMSWSNFLRKGSYLDLDYIYSALSNSDGEDPVDYEAFWPLLPNMWWWRPTA